MILNTRNSSTLPYDNNKSQAITSNNTDTPLLSTLPCNQNHGKTIYYITKAGQP